MAKLEKFEDLMAWQKARELSQTVYRITRDSGWAKDRRLTDQIQGASVAAMSCTAESFGRWDTSEALGLLSEALTAAMSVRTCLYVAYDAGYVDGKTFDEVRELAEHASRAIGGWRGGVAKRRNGNRSDGRSSDRGTGSTDDRRDDAREDRRAAYQGR